MKRDFDLVRMILAEVEGMPPACQLQHFTYPGIEDAVAKAHVVLLTRPAFLMGRFFVPLNRETMHGKWVDLE